LVELVETTCPLIQLTSRWSSVSSALAGWSSGSRPGGLLPVDADW